MFWQIPETERYTYKIIKKALPNIDGFFESIHRTDLTRKLKEPFQISLEKKREVKGRELPMAALKETLEGQLQTPKVISGIQVMVRKIP